MTELLTITMFGAVIGAVLFGGSFWVQNKWDEEEKVRGCIQDPSATGGETHARGYANPKFSGADH